jgi:hypothetical protein
LTIPVGRGDNRVYQSAFKGEELFDAFALPWNGSISRKSGLVSKPS